MGKWFVDGFDLSRYAFNVRNRSAGWSLAAKRGENLVLPGRSGSRHAEQKPMGEGKVSLQMWAVGTDYDGTLPDDVDRREMTLKHLDRLSTLFGGNGLLELARVEDDSVQYGRENLLANGGMDAIDQQVLLDVNYFANANMEESTAADTVLRTNNASNPNGVVDGTSPVTRTNLVPDPSFVNLTSVQTAANVTAKAKDTTDKIAGADSVALTFGSGSTIYSNLFKAIAASVTNDGSRFSGSIHLKVKSGMSSLPIIVGLECYDSSYAYLGFSKDGAGADKFLTGSVQSSAWSQVKIEDSVLPAGTAYVLVSVAAGAAVSNGTVLLVDAAMVEKAPATGAYFDGASTSGNGITYTWSGTANASTSRMAEMMPSGWATDATTCVLRRESYGGTDGSGPRCRVKPGLTPKLLVRHLAVEPSALQTNIVDSSFSFQVRVNRARSIRLQAAKSDGTVLWQGPAIALAADTWTTVKMEDWTINVPSLGTQNITVWWKQVETTDASTSTDTLDVRRAMNERLAQIGPYFDGASGTGYRWYNGIAEGTSEQFGARPLAWNPTSYQPDLNTAYQTASDAGTSVVYGPKPEVLHSTEHATGGTKSVRLIAKDAGDVMMTSGSASVRRGRTITISADVWSAVERTFVIGYYGFTIPGGKALWQRDTIVVPANTTTRIKRTYTMPTTGTGVFLVPSVGFAATAVNQEVFIDRAAASFNADGVFRDGNTPGWAFTKQGAINGIDYSVMYGDGVAYWQADNGTVLPSDEWDAVRGRSAFVESDSTLPVVVTPFGYPTTVDSPYPVEEGEIYRFGVSGKARDDIRVRIGLAPGRMESNGFEYAATVWSDPVDLEVDEEFDLEVATMPAKWSADYTHVLPKVSISSPGDSNTMTADKGLWLGRAYLTTAVGLGYFDGDDPYVAWEGDEHRSPSKIIGPARRALIEVNAEVDMTSMAGGTRAEFTVEGVIPTTFWEDSWEVVQELLVNTTGEILLLDEFVGMTGPIEDAKIELIGSFGRPLRLTDLASGGWIEINQSVTTAAPITIDNETWSVTAAGSSIMTKVTHGGHPRLLPLTVGGRDRAPRLKIEGTIGLGGSRVRVTARRKYHLA